MSWQKDDVRDWFSDRGVADKWCDMYDTETDQPDEHFFRLRRDFAVSLIAQHFTPSSRILDFGCGAGPVIADLNHAGYDCLGIDYSDDMIRHTKRRLSGLGMDERRVIRGDCAKAPFADSEFDGIVCLGVISYLEDYGPVLREIQRMLKPNGIALISFRNKFNPIVSDPIASGKWLIRKLIGSSEQDEEHLGRFLAPRVVSNDIAASGLSVRSCEGIGFGPFRVNGRPVVSGRTAIRINDSLAQLLKQLRLAGVFSWMTDVNVFVCERTPPDVAGHF